jgi:two-component system, OmpR family, KDP operon response regulator KdpE
MNHKVKVLFIDDEQPIRKLLKHILSDEGYTIFEASNVKEGITQASLNIPDIILLDLGLPDGSGEEVLKTLREWTQAPIIILTANKADDDKVKLLDMGADDYLVKPFHAPELLARMRVALRHLHKDDNPLIQIGNLSIDLSGHLVKVKDEEIKLTAKEYEFLKILAKSAGKIVTQGQILKEIWGPNNEENSHYLRVYVAQLRKKVEEPLGRKLIVTESGIGYRLLVD